MATQKIDSFTWIFGILVLLQYWSVDQCLSYEYLPRYHMGNHNSETVDPRVLALIRALSQANGIVESSVNNEGLISSAAHINTDDYYDIGSPSKNNQNRMDFFDTQIARSSKENINPNLKSVWAVEWLKMGKIGKESLGQCVSVATDKAGNVWLLHRGSRIWDQNSFNVKNEFNQSQGPIRESVLLKVEPRSGKLLDKYLANEYYMPHSITIDIDENVWIIDVALHQIFKYKMGSFKKPVLTLGTRFEPGTDHNHFCKPTDVAISSITGQFFISDGYCNNRILKYDANGNLISVFGRSEWGWLTAQAPNFLLVPHSLALIERLDLICVADRENFRILCLRAGTLTAFNDGDIFRDYNNPRLKTILPRFEYQISDVKGVRYKPYGISYSPKADKLYVVAQSTVGPFVIFGGQLSLPDNSINLDSWFQFPDYSTPHDLSVSDNDDKGYSKYVYVADTNQQLWKFNETRILP